MQDMTFGSPLALQRTRTRARHGSVRRPPAPRHHLWGEAGTPGSTGWLKVSIANDLVAPPQPTPTALVSEPAAIASANLAATDAALTTAAAEVSALEQRLAELNQQAMNAAGQASQAEALLCGFRRPPCDRARPAAGVTSKPSCACASAIPSRLRLHQVIAAAQKPMTLSTLGARLRATPPATGRRSEERRQLGLADARDKRALRHPPR